MKRIALLALAAALGDPAAAAAGKKSVPQAFYEAKKRASSPDAFARAERNLARVSVGMGELAFLEQMQMEVLAQGKKPFDARLDGYLVEASRRLNAAQDGLRYLVFGYVEREREVPRITVALRDRRVFSVRPAVEPVALAGDAARD